MRDAVSRARENAAVASPDPFNELPAAEPIEPLDGLFSEAIAGMSTEQKVPIALGMERAATTMDPRVRKTESVRYGDAVGAAGYNCTQWNMAGVGLPPMPDAIPDAVLADIDAAAKASGVAIVALSGTYNMIHSDPTVRADGLRRLGKRDLYH